MLSHWVLKGSVDVRDSLHALSSQWAALDRACQPMCLMMLQIVLSVAEHHGNLVPWQMLAQRTGAVLRHAKLTPTQEVDIEVTAMQALALVDAAKHPAP